MPYRTIEVVFNKSNVWANLQNPEPTRIYYDLWNNNYWHPFSTTVSEMQPFFSSSANRMPRSDQWMEDNTREVYGHVHEAIEAYRQNQSCTVVWQKDTMLTNYLQKGLQLMFEYEVAAENDQPIAGERIADWRRLLYSKVPEGLNLVCLPMFFNYTSPKDVGDGVVARCGFLNCREAGTQFTVAVHIDRMPNRLVALYVCVAMIHSLTELQIQEVLARRQREQRELDVFADEDHMNLIQISEANAAAAAWDTRDRDDILTRDVDYIVGRIEEMQAGEHSLDFGGSFDSQKGQSSGALASVLNDAHREEKVRPPAGWAKRVHSEYVKLTDNGLVAEYRRDVGSEKEEVTLGMVIGDAPVEHFRFIGWYFEVKLLERQEREGEWADGLTLGVTTASPEDVLAEGIPYTIADLDWSWSMGYDGRSISSETESDFEWNPSTLKPGDTVGLSVTTKGQMILVVNDGKQFILGPAEIPVDEIEMYPVADLLGAARAISLNVGAQPPRCLVKWIEEQTKKNESQQRTSGPSSSTADSEVSIAPDSGSLTVDEKPVITEYTRVKEIVVSRERYNRFPDGTYVKHYDDDPDSLMVEEEVLVRHESMDLKSP
ncbi:hypothetical protein FOZ60_013235 [Perkinsus olseni]|uniref:B30.2/SPRY domain-containing protein n=1 Tax=Perkinsus olseni TaxID=32597 RepID=A0A7J6N9L3_PEROL|nr:hypothetical protein FOZ60_013235 [Perkinsus olseni]